MHKKSEECMYIEIIGVIIIIMALRAIITKNRSERLLYINVIDFGISAIIALYINTPFALILAAAFFICSTISSNAIAYSLKRLDKEIIVEK
jgi:energy-converting hydrogenase A subunit C